MQEIVTTGLLTVAATVAATFAATMHHVNDVIRCPNSAKKADVAREVGSQNNVLFICITVFMYISSQNICTDFWVWQSKPWPWHLCPWLHHCSPEGSTFLCELTSWLPSWKCDVITLIRLHQTVTRCVFTEGTILLKFIPIRFETMKPQTFFEEVDLALKKNNKKMSITIYCSSAAFAFQWCATTLKASFAECPAVKILGALALLPVSLRL